MVDVILNMLFTIDDLDQKKKRTWVNNLVLKFKFLSSKV